MNLLIPIPTTTLYINTYTTQITFGINFFFAQEISIPKYNAYYGSNVVPKRHSSLPAGKFLQPVGSVIPCD
jgi:hypothetical protein